MRILLPFLGIVFAAFCIWLTIRIINRQERWAKWTAIALAAVPVLYVLSLGPVCWSFSPVSQVPTANLPTVRQVPQIYRPFGWAARHEQTLVGTAINWYATLGLGDQVLECETELDEHYNVIIFAK